MSAARFSRYLTEGSGIQKPERSGLPYGVRCVGAFRSTFPSGVRGTLFHGYGSHCAAATAVMLEIIAREAMDRHSVFLHVFIMSFPLRNMAGCYTGSTENASLTSVL